MNRLFRPYNWFLWLGGVLALSMICCVFQTLIGHPYLGEGHFEDRSFWIPLPPFRIRGYTIDLPPFDLANDFEATFDLATLPTFGETGVYFAILDPNNMLQDEVLRRDLRATVQLNVYDQNQKSVCHVDHSLGRMSWAESEGGTYGLYDLDKSFFYPNANTAYSLHVNYSADPQLSGCKGFVHLRCGGSL